MNYKYDIILFIDFNSLVNIDFETLNKVKNDDCKVRILSSEIEKLNNFYKSITDNELKVVYKNKIKEINDLVTNKMMGFLSNKNPQNLEYNLVELLLKNYDKKNILIFTETLDGVNNIYLFKPIYLKFNQHLDIIASKDVSDLLNDNEEPNNEVINNNESEDLVNEVTDETDSETTTNDVINETDSEVSVNDTDTSNQNSNIDNGEGNNSESISEETQSQNVVDTVDSVEISSSNSFEPTSDEDDDFNF